MKAAKKKLQESIYPILCQHWDPIGIYQQQADWDDEYSCYIPAGYRCLLNADSVVKVQQLLENIAFNSMGLNRFPNHNRHQTAATQLWHKKAELGV